MTFLTFNRSNISLFVLLFSALAPMFSFFGFHLLYLTSIVASGSILFLFFVFKERKRPAEIYFLLLVLFMLLVSLFNLGLGYGYLISMANDISTTGLFIIAFLLSGLNPETLKSSIIFLIAVSLSTFFYVVFFYGFSSFLGQLDRDLIYKELMSQSQEVGFNSAIDLTSITSFCISYSVIYLVFLPLFASRINIKIYTLILLLIIIQFVIYELINQKRQVIVEFTILYISSLFLTNKLYPNTFLNSRKVQFLMLFVFIFFITQTDFYKIIVLRFTETGKNLAEFDRLEEANLILSEYSFLNYLFGNGFGWLSSKAVSTGETVHIGYMNLLNKGGIIYIIFYLIHVIKNIIYCIKKSKLYPEYSVGVTISILSLVQLSFAPGYGWYLSSIITGMAMFSRYFLDSYVNRLYLFRMN